MENRERNPTDRGLAMPKGGSAYSGQRLCDRFLLPGDRYTRGAELFNGLPGMILGLAIPRYYTTWFATKIELADIDESKISSQENKKDKAYGKKELAEILVKKYKEAGWEEASINKVFEMLNRYTF